MTKVEGVPFPDGRMTSSFIVVVTGTLYESLQKTLMNELWVGYQK